MGFSRQEYWSSLLCPAPGDLPNPGIKPISLASPALQAGSLSTEPPGSPNKPWYINMMIYYLAKNLNYCCPQHNSTKGLGTKELIFHNSIYMGKIMEILISLLLCLSCKYFSKLIKLYTKTDYISPKMGRSLEQTFLQRGHIHGQ